MIKRIIFHFVIIITLLVVPNFIFAQVPDLGTAVDSVLFSSNGAVKNTGITVVIPSASLTTGIDSPGIGETATFYPNPFTTLLVVRINESIGTTRSELKIYNILGTIVMDKIITKSVTVLETYFKSGVYFYVMTNKNGKVQSGKLISIK